MFGAAFAWLSRRGLGLACAAAPFLWVTLEYGRTHLPDIGFPWNLLGYAAAENLAFVQVVTITGIYGLSLVVAAYNSLVAWAVARLTERTLKPLIVLLSLTLVVVVVGFLGPRWVPRETPRLTARLVQTNFPQTTEGYPVDWYEQHAAELDVLERLSLAPATQRPTLVIWPEAPAPFSMQEPKFAARAERVARESGAWFLSGVVEWRREDGHYAAYNSAVLLDAEGRQAFLYDKIHLVPFGEYVPWSSVLSFAKQLTSEVGGFRAGSEYKVGEIPGGRIGVFICYEAIFPGEVRRFVANGATLLVNLSNDGWFFGPTAPQQHLLHARVRAVENRRWLLRGTNTGETVAIDSYGRTVAQLHPDVRGAMDVPYYFRSDLTPYARWGNWLAWLSVLMALVLLAVGTGKGRK